MSGFSTSPYGQHNAFAAVGAPTGTENTLLTGANISPGASGDTVVLLQQQLQSWGFSPGTVDGVYGANTQAAVTALQRKLGVPTSGVFDVQTQEAVLNDLNSSSSVIRGTQASTLTSPSGGTATPAAAANTPAAQVAAVATSPWLIGGIAVALAAGLYWWYRRRKYTVPSVAGVEQIGDDLWPPDQRKKRRGNRRALRAGQNRMKDCSAQWKRGEDGGHKSRKAFMSQCLKG
jgi:hypothetical protein